ncbi:hypothetical protein EV421DRAFT_1924833 [Armillaria borealis]|uniref:Uncharacterized protein n=1 Tax=Armillaria borealis TaxID=47425 RepID=A0AA39MF51_9AGAR|nr:hypothetical protein EV421DRAFT_1924833 [Armillaria borealis]
MSGSPSRLILHSAFCIDSSNAPGHPASNTSSTPPDIQLEHGLVPSTDSTGGSLMQELLGGGSVDGLNGFQGMNPMALQALMSSFSHSNYTAQMPFSPNTYYLMMGMNNGMPGPLNLMLASPNTMGMPTISPVAAPTFPMNTTKVLGSEPGITNAQDKACILQDPAVTAMLREMIQEGIEQGLARTKSSSGGGTGIRKQRDGNMEYGKVLYNLDWTAKAQASINVEFRAVVTALIMQNKKLSEDVKMNQQINLDARSKSIHRKINTRHCKHKKALGHSQQKQLKIKRPAWRNKRLKRLYSALQKLSVEEGGTQVHSRVVDNTDMDTDAHPLRFTYKAWVSKTWFQSQTQDIILKDNAANMPILSFHIPDEDLDEDDIGQLADDEADDLE